MIRQGQLAKGWPRLSFSNVYKIVKGLNLVSMEMVTLLMVEGGLWRMLSSQDRGGYQVHLGDDDYYGDEDDDEDDCGVGAGVW